MDKENALYVTDAILSDLSATQKLTPCHPSTFDFTAKHLNN